MVVMMMARNDFNTITILSYGWLTKLRFSYLQLAQMLEFVNASNIITPRAEFELESYFDPQNE